MSSDDHVRSVLHAARLVGLASLEHIVDRSGLDAEATQRCLASCVEAGWIRYRDGRVSGWMLTTDGRGHGEVLLAEEVHSIGGYGAVEREYTEFLVLNPLLLSLCTDWQLRPVDGAGVEAESSPDSVLNDHSDALYDAAVIARLGELHELIDPIVARTASVLSRFERYRPRLDHALGRVRAGDIDWFTRPVIDSYHTIWFELHEDLLATLGRERSSELN